jgi:hypothetical protein
MEQNDSLYERARQLLREEPGMGKKRLADRLGVRTPTSRRLLHRYRGETQGHSKDVVYQKVRQLKDANLDWGAGRIANQLGITVDHAMMHLARWAGAQNYQGGSPPTSPSIVPAEPEAPADGAELQISGNDDSQAMSYRGSRIKTIEDLLAFSKTDTRIWEVEKHVINKWEVGAKDPLSGGILTEPLYQLKLWLRRKVAEQKLQAVMEGLLEQFRKAAPIRPALPRRPSAKGLLEISIMDHHLGKYCASAETRGMAYDCDISERLFITALEDLLQKSANLPVEKVLMVCGNDFLNTADGRATERQTIQDEDRRYHETFLRGRQLLVRAIDRLREVAPVGVVMVTGNHEGQRLYYLGSALECWYRNTPDVVVDNRPTQRKYVQYHRNLIGFTHGHQEKHHDLPLLLALDTPEGWAASRHREFHLGHFHSRKLKMFVPSFDRGGVLVRILPSLCPPDAWHAAMGYRSRLSAEALYFDPEEGCVANFIHSPN